MNKKTWKLDPAGNGSDVLADAMRHLFAWVVPHMGVKENERLQLTLEPYKETRRLRQNALYWVLVNATAKQLCNGEYLPRAWDLYYREKHIGLEGSPIMESVTIAEHKRLLVGDFSDYLDKCFAEASENHVLLPEQSHAEHRALQPKVKA